MTDDLDLTGTAESTPTEDKMMASFRVDRDEWNRFGLLAKRERLNATQVLTEYIQKCLDANRTYFNVSMDTDESSIDTKSVSTNTDDVLKLVDERISTAISTLSLQTLDTNVSMDTDEILSLIDSKISTAISTLSLLTTEDVSTAISTAISTALVPLQGEIAKFLQAPTNRVEISKTIEAIAPKPARKPPEALDLNTVTEASWVVFHKALGLDCLPSSHKSVELGLLATDRAIELGFVGWTFDGKKQRFNRT